MNLAESKTRDVAQQEQIGRRASIVPEKRDTRAPAFNPQGDMRSARRGDGGAEELMRTLGMVQRAGNTFVEYAQNKHAAAEQDNMAQGAVDQLAGTIDPVMEEKSLGYRNAVTKGRTMTQFSEAQQNFDEELRGLIEGQEDPILENRQAQVRERLEGFYKDFATDPETGELKSFLQSPTAMRYLAETIQRSRPQFEAAAMQRIEERFNGEALNLVGKDAINQAVETGTVDIARLRSIVPATVPEETFRKTLVTSLSNAAQALHAKGRSVDAIMLYDGILGKPESTPPGTSEASLGPAGATQGLASGVRPVVSQGASQGTGGRVSFNTLRDAVEWQESRGNPNAVSPVGARGKMQTMPGTLRDPGYGVKPAKDDSPAELTRVGNDYLKAMLREYNGDLVLALAAYNAGPGRADEWKSMLQGKTIAQKIALIPFKETREYVQNILGRVGVAGGGTGEGGAAVAPDDPVNANPEFRLQRPGADPITAYEQAQALTAKPLPGMDQIQLAPEEIARLREERNQLANTARQEWDKKQSEEKEFNASSMALRLYGQGAPLTSVEITEAIRDGTIDPKAGMSLFNLLRSNTNAAQSYQDRQTALADRNDKKKQDEEIARYSGRFLGGMLSGRLTGPQARQQALELLPTIRDPIVQAAVANTVLAGASDIENLVVNSEPVRRTLREFDDQRTAWADTLGSTSRGRANIPAANALIDQAQAEYATRVKDGEPEATAKSAVASKYVPRLQALVPAQRKPK